MSRQPKAVLLACGLALSVAASATTAQVAPPPTGPANDQPTYTPPPKPEPKPEVKPADPEPQEGFSARRRDRSTEDLNTNVPYPKLAQPGPDGRIIRLRQLPDIAALRSNPNVGPASVELIMPLIYLRRFKMETSVIDNLDLYWELSGGLVDNMNMSDINQMGRVADMMKPLVPEVTLSQDLLNRQILSRIQGGMNKYIVNEYKKAITDEIQVLDGEKGLEEVMRFVLKDSLHEAKLAYQGLLVELMDDVAEVVDLAGIEKTSAVQALIEAQQEPVAEQAAQFDQIAAFDAVFRELSYEDANAIFTALRATREFENIAPTITTVNVLHERKKVYTGDFGTKITDGKTGEVRFNSVTDEKKPNPDDVIKEEEKEGGDN
jgi:hypothetical protein